MRSLLALFPIVLLGCGFDTSPLVSSHPHPSSRLFDDAGSGAIAHLAGAGGARSSAAGMGAGGRAVLAVAGTGGHYVTVGSAGDARVGTSGTVGSSARGQAGARATGGVGIDSAGAGAAGSLGTGGSSSSDAGPVDADAGAPVPGLTCEPCMASTDCARGYFCFPPVRGDSDGPGNRCYLPTSPDPAFAQNFGCPTPLMELGGVQPKTVEGMGATPCVSLYVCDYWLMHPQNGL